MGYRSLTLDSVDEDHLNNSPRVVYSPESQVHNLGQLFVAMWIDIKASRELAWRLFVRDLAAQYRQSMLGVFWTFLPPIVTGIIFILLQSSNVINFGQTDIPYPIYVLVGTVLWQVFTESLNAPLKAAASAKPLLVRVNFPREAVIISAIYLVLFNLGIRMFVLAVFLLIFKVTPTWGIVLAPIALLMLMLLGICIGLLLTPIGLLFTDITTSLPIVTQIFFFVTPVVYPPPDSLPFSLIASLNPVSPLLITTRELITKGTVTNIFPFLVVSALILIFMLIAWVLYRISMPIIIERMSA